MARYPVFGSLDDWGVLGCWVVWRVDDFWGAWWRGAFFLIAGVVVGAVLWWSIFWWRAALSFLSPVRTSLPGYLFELYRC